MRLGIDVGSTTVKLVFLDDDNNIIYSRYERHMSNAFLKVQELKNFRATFKNNRLILDFDTKFSVPVQADYTMLVVAVADPTNYIQITTDMEKADVDAPDAIEVEFFNDALSGLTLFRAFRSDIEGLYLRFKKK